MLGRIFTYDNFKFKAGEILFSQCPTIFQVDDVILISNRKDKYGNSLISAKFYNAYNKLLAEIVDNEWKAYLDNEFWDIQYSPGHLKINNEKNKIFLEFRLKEDYFELRAEMYCNGFKIILQPNKTQLGNLGIKDMGISNCKVGVHVKTR